MACQTLLPQQHRLQILLAPAWPALAQQEMWLWRTQQQQLLRLLVWMLLLLLLLAV